MKKKKKVTFEVDRKLAKVLITLLPLLTNPFLLMQLESLFSVKQKVVSFTFDNP